MDNITNQPYVLTHMAQTGESMIRQEVESPVELRSGDQCPLCNQGTLDYDGMLNLTCPNCGFEVGGCFT